MFYLARPFAKIIPLTSIPRPFILLITLAKKGLGVQLWIYQIRNAAKHSPSYLTLEAAVKTT
jgi:hypothetical protein